MPRLLAGDLTARKVFTLQPGLNRLGRADSCNIRVDDPSVSGFHCELILEGEVLRIRDLGSTNGTLVAGQLITEGVLRIGDSFKAGGVEMHFEDDFTTAESRLKINGFNAQAEVGPVEAFGLPGHCKYHPNISTEYKCQNCGGEFCAGCVKTIQAGRSALHSCPLCESSCLGINELQQQADRARSFYSAIGPAFKYPLNMDGLIILFGGTVLFALLSVAIDFFGMAGLGRGRIIWLLLVIAGVGYTFAFMQSIMSVSSLGNNHMPDWPELFNFKEDLVGPFFRFAGTIIICFAPGIFGLAIPVIGVLLLLLGIFVFPMALMGVALTDSITGMDPRVVFPSIARLRFQYLTTVLFLFGLFITAVVIEAVTDRIGIPVLPRVITIFANLYLLSVGMRVLGLLYFKNLRKLGWQAV